MVWAWSYKTERAKAKAAGADEFFVKPLMWTGSLKLFIK
jgi:hypothetical protein